MSDAPDNVELAAPVDVSGLETLLSKKIGISENLFTPPDDHSRQPLSANIRHAMFYCIQGQDEIAAQKFLFHKQSEPFVPQAIKDTLPYFLGIVNKHNLELVAERTRLKRECLIIQRSLDEVEQLQGNGLERATALIEEAKAVGLIANNATIDLNDYLSVRSTLKEICQWNPVDIEINGLDRISYLQTQIKNDQIALENSEIDIQNAREFLHESKSVYIDQKQVQSKVYEISSSYREDSLPITVNPLTFPSNQDIETLGVDTQVFIDVRLERKKEVIDAYHSALEKADPAAAKEATTKKQKGEDKKKSSDISL